MELTAEVTSVERVAVSDYFDELPDLIEEGVTVLGRCVTWARQASFGKGNACQTYIAKTEHAGPIFRPAKIG